MNSKYLTVATVIVVLLVSAFGYGYTQLRGANSAFQNVTVQDLAELEASERFVLDVREDWEYQAGHVPGAVLIPLGELSTRVNELPDDEPIYVICRSGNRSLQASDILKEAEVTDIRNVQGGTLAWEQAGLPLDQ